MMLSAKLLACRSSGTQRLVSPTGPVFRRFSDALPKKKDPTGMDVGSWSWRWRLAGGVAVAVITPYCFKTLIQINWEAREFFEPWAPWLVQYVRENYGFPDEDPERREHVARMEKLYSEEVRVSVSSPASVAPEWSGALPGSISVADLADRAATQSGPDVGALVTQLTDACVRFEDASAEGPAAVDTKVASGSMSDSWSESAEAVDGRANSMTAESATGEGANLRHMLNFVRSMWEADDVATAAAERAIEQAAQLSPQEVAQRGLVRDLVAVQPISPPLQQQQQQQQQAGGSSAAAAASTAPTAHSSRRRQGSSDDVQLQEANLRAKIAALEAERHSGDSARPIDDLNEELDRLRAHLKALRGWRFW